MADDYSMCSICGAAVDNISRHRSWHDEVESKLSSLEALIRRRTLS